MEWVLIYFYMFGAALGRLGISEWWAFWTGVYLFWTAIVSFFAIFFVKSVGVRWFLFFFALVTLLVPAWEFLYRFGEKFSRFH